jgi:hypothetical protein
VGSFWANVLTTIIGYPVSWALHVAVEMAVGYPLGYLFSKFQNIDWLGYALFPLISAWLMPGVDQWIIYLAGIFGLIPALWISVKIEGNLLQRLFNQNDKSAIKKVVWKANKTTYLILAAFLGIMSSYHGLIKLHAFDFLRDRSDERVAFNSKLEGDILVSSDSDVFLFDLKDNKKKKFLSEDPKEIHGARFENQAMYDSQIWFTVVNFDNGRQEKLYRYDFVHGALKEMPSVKNINKIIPVKNGAFVFSGETYRLNGGNQKDDGIFKVSNDGHIQKVFDDGLTVSDESGVISPSGDKIAELRITNSKDLNIINTGPFLVQVELRIYDLTTKENTKIAELWGVFGYKNVDVFHISWHPSEDILYFSNTEFNESLDTFLKQVNLTELKQRYGTDGLVFNSEAMDSLLKKLGMKTRTGIFK